MERSVRLLNGDCNIFHGNDSRLCILTALQKYYLIAMFSYFVQLLYLKFDFDCPGFGDSVYAVGGATRNLSGHWKTNCYQVIGKQISDGQLSIHLVSVSADQSSLSG